MYEEKDMEKAVETVGKGGVILYPTDTVWGLGCDATREETVRRISRIKNRPEKKGFIILVASAEMLLQYARNIPEELIREMSSPERPTTYILPGLQRIAPSLIHSDRTVGVRIPDDAFCRELSERLGVPLVSTSANFAGEKTPASFREIDPELKKQVDYIVRWRQDDPVPARPSRIVKILPDGTRQMIRP